MSVLVMYLSESSLFGLATGRTWDTARSSRERGGH